MIPILSSAPVQSSSVMKRRKTRNNNLKCKEVRMLCHTHKNKTKQQQQQNKQTSKTIKPTKAKNMKKISPSETGTVKKNQKKTNKKTNKKNETKQSKTKNN